MFQGASYRRAGSPNAAPAGARLQLARRRVAEFRRQLAQHADIVRGLELLGEDQRLAADLVKRVFELGESDRPD